MKSENVVAQKSYAFALRALRAGRFLIREQKEFVVSRQLMKSGTSIGANVEEAVGGQSRADFFAKISIAYKEARETSYWIRLSRDAGLLSPSQAASLLVDVDELLRLLGTIQVATKRAVKRPHPSRLETPRSARLKVSNS